jgi:hypothetical protein
LFILSVLFINREYRKQLEEDKESQISKGSIKRHYSFKKQAPYGISVINNFNIRLLEVKNKDTLTSFLNANRGISTDRTEIKISESKILNKR